VHENEQENRSGEDKCMRAKAQRPGRRVHASATVKLR